MSRFQLNAFRDQRAVAVLAMIVLGAVLTPLLGILVGGQIEGFLPRVRFYGRLAGIFMLCGVLPAAMATIRAGITNISAPQHRTSLRAYPLAVTGWQILMTLDGLFLIMLPDLLAIGPLALDAVLTLAAFATPALLWHNQAWFYGFQPRELLSGARDYEEFGMASSESPLDTLDYRVLRLVADAGGDPLPIMVNDIGVGYYDLLLRLKKLVVLRYIDALELMHGPQLVLTTKATDMLALPVSLFAWELDEPDLLRGLAEARLALEQGENQKVVVECARLSERILRRSLQRDAPDVTKIGGKTIEKATLGELIQANRNDGRLGRFEENVLAAINERRKKIHAIEELGPINI